MSSLRAITIGNFLRIVSCPAWGHSVHLNRKPFGAADFSTPLRCARNDGSVMEPLPSFPWKTFLNMPIRYHRKVGNIVY